MKHSGCNTLPYFLCFLYLSSVLQTKGAVLHWFTYFNMTAVSLKKIYLTGTSFLSLGLFLHFELYLTFIFLSATVYYISPISHLLFRQFYLECPVSLASPLACFWLVWRLSGVGRIYLLKFHLINSWDASPCMVNVSGIQMALKLFGLLKLK